MRRPDRSYTASMPVAVAAGRVMPVLSLRVTTYSADSYDGTPPLRPLTLKPYTCPDSRPEKAHSVLPPVVTPSYPSTGVRSSTLHAAVTSSIVTNPLSRTSVSLTVAALGGDWFEVAAIPTTLRETTLGDLPVGGRANLEADLVGAYVRRALGQDSLSLDQLIAAGFAD